MPEYDNNLRGVLFKNDKNDNPRAPQYKGNMTVDNKDYWLSCWVEKSKAGQSYMSLSLQPKEDHPQQQADVNTEAQVEADGFEDDIPF